MPNGRQYIRLKQKCHRNCQQSQQKQPQQALAQQHSVSGKHVKRCEGRSNQLIALMIILIGIIKTTTALPDGPVASSTSGALNGDIRGDGDNAETASYQNSDIIGEIVEEIDLDNGPTGDGNIGTQYRNGFHTKFSSVDKEVVDRLIKQWAPIVWLAPEEKFMPLGVDEFLNHVHPRDKGKTFIPGMPIGDDSKKAYLVTNEEIDELLENEKSFIYGRNPNESPVPIYAVVTLCNQPMRKTVTKLTPAAPPTAPPTSPFNGLQQKLLVPATQQFLPSSTSTLASTIPISSTRGPYIPVSIDPLDVRNDTVRRSSRLYPVFKRVRRNSLRLVENEYNLPLSPPIVLNLPPKGLVVEPYSDLVLGESSPVAAEQSTGAADVTTTDSPIQADNSGQVNNFIANLVDNVKFSMPVDDMLEDNSIDVGSSFDHLVTNNAGERRKLRKKMPSFHVTYWMFYPYSQGKTMCTLSLGPLGSIPFPAVYGFCLGRRKDIGSHIGDWEHMSLYFTGDAEPEAMYVSAHDAGAYYSYNRLTGSFEFKKQETRKGILQRPNFPKTVTTFNNHPVLFAAKGSHGLWTAPGKHRFVKVARLYDINGFGTPWNTWKSVDISYENLKSYGRALVPSWLSFKGKWGNPKSKCHPFRRIGLNFCEYTDGPTGIPLKEPHFQCGAA
uniref:Vacuolar protein sorting-associated protein 62 n=1 Tax=Bactrocera dorsalis TaxID=27457 RepID=A0A034VQC0_BACDO